MAGLNLLPIFVTLGCMFGLSSATNFTVTSSNCTGVGSITEAIIKANAQPGLDTITFSPGLTVKIDNYACGLALGTRPLSENFIGLINESVTFIGNGALLDGCQSWLNNRGQINSQGSGFCPRDDNLVTYCTSPGFIRVGVPGQDNAGIRVGITGLRVKHLEQVAQLEDGASLSIDQSAFESIYAQVTCSSSPINGEGNNVINVTRSSFKDCWIWTRGSVGGTIQSSGPRLYVYDTTFDLCKTQSSVTFSASSSTDVANIVSCRFQNLAEGVAAYNQGTMNIYNTLMNFGYPFYEGAQFHRVIAGPSSTVNLVASTVVIYSAEVQKYLYNARVEGAPLVALRNAIINVDQSAISSATLPGVYTRDFLLYVNSTGSLPAGLYTASQCTYMTATTNQTAGQLQALTAQPSLIANPPSAMGLLRAELPDDNEAQYQTPLLDGPLIDCIPNANTTNLLINPQDGLPILTDVFGNPRVDANGRRNIGAIQNTLAPYLTAQNNGSGGAVLLNWVSPLQPGNLTGYHVCYCLAGPAACALDCSTATGTSSCPNGLDIANAMALSTTVTGLQNGQTYQFCVSGVKDGTFGPSSNIATATPYGPVTAPRARITGPVGCNYIGVAWDEPDLGGLSLLEYAVVYFPQLKTDWATTVESTSQSVELTGPFLANTAYTICVVAVAIEFTSGNLRYGNPGCVNATTVCTSPLCTDLLGLSVSPSKCKRASRSLVRSVKLRNPTSTGISGVVVKVDFPVGMGIKKAVPQAAIDTTQGTLTWSAVSVPANGCWSGSLRMTRATKRWKDDNGTLRATASFFSSGNQNCLISGRW